MKGEASPSPARLIIADDHVLIREGTRALLANEPDIEVVGEAENGRQALELCRSLSPDLVLMDIRMPEMNGLAATRAIQEECPTTSVLVMTGHENLDHLLEAIRAGAAGYVLKEATRQQLLSAIRRALVGESPLNQELAMQLLKRMAKEDNWQAELLPRSTSRRQEGLFEPLTARELEVLRLLSLGKTNREVTQALSISLSTVKGHVQRIIAKLKVSDRTQAAVRAVELGLLPSQKET